MINEVEKLIKIRENLQRHISEKIPAFEIVSKQESFFMKVLSKILFFNKAFMSRYITTIYPKMYVPSLPWKEDNPISAIIVMAHEYVHMADRKRMGPLFNLLYLAPQVFALGAVGVFWSWWWLLCLLFLLPIPSVGRTWLEFRAYMVSLAAYYWITDQKPAFDFYIKQFTTSSYYWMLPSQKYLEKQFQKHFEKTINGELAPIQKEIKEILYKE